MPSGESTTLNVTGDFTVSVWFKTDQGINGMIGCGDNSGVYGGGYLFALGNYTFDEGVISAMSGNLWVGGTTAHNDLNWHHGVATFLSTN